MNQQYMIKYPDQMISDYFFDKAFQSAYLNGSGSKTNKSKESSDMKSLIKSGGASVETEELPAIKNIY